MSKTTAIAPTRIIISERRTLLDEMKGSPYTALCAVPSPRCLKLVYLYYNPETEEQLLVNVNFLRHGWLSKQALEQLVSHMINTTSGARNVYGETYTIASGAITRLT